MKLRGITALLWSVPQGEGFSPSGFHCEGRSSSSACYWSPLNGNKHCCFGRLCKTKLEAYATFSPLCLTWIIKSSWPLCSRPFFLGLVYTQQSRTRCSSFFHEKTEAFDLPCACFHSEQCGQSLLPNLLVRNSQLLEMKSK